VIDTDDTPGGCWFHFSVVDSPSGHPRDLVTGQQVDFMFEAVPDKDGYAYRATHLFLGGTGTTSEQSAAYSSRLRVELSENGLAD
jgi:CspA family cold shock protein